MSADFQRFKRRFKETSGLDLDQYKEQQMQRRISQWLARVGADYGEYLKRLETDRSEMQRFLEYLTINTSQFYRDVQVFSRIHTEVLPALLAGSRRLKIWSAGCSVGAEIYTIAILLQELAPGSRHTLLGTDLDEQALVKAAEAVYAPKLVNTMPKELVSKYFTRDEKGNYVLTDKIKRMVTFKKQNLLTDPFDDGFDLILCRNVFIYFTAEAQARLTSRFSESLKPGGYFIVGSAENLPNPEKYHLTRRAYCIYQKREMDDGQ